MNSSTPTLGVEREQSNIVYGGSDSDLAAKRSPVSPITNGNLALTSIVDLTIAAKAESTADIRTTAVQSSASLLIDFTEV